MSDLISRKDVIEVCDWWQHEYDESASRIDDIISWVAEGIKNLPTADPVKHGRWIDRRSIAAPNRYECSVCKRMTIVDECMGEPIYCYCPWCGAKTKGAE